ncbi:hypothetical protein KCP77_16600 [Salmonella enterica subsp. enterica]|nr:hypothetical protein KCP77_16600 [Salmonella enterica subsp. enterica]
MYWRMSRPVIWMRVMPTVFLRLLGELSRLQGTAFLVVTHDFATGEETYEPPA